MIEVNLHANVEDTNEFQRLLREKTEEGLMLLIRKEYREGRLKPKLELIKQTDDYSKDAKLIIKEIGEINGFSNNK